MKCITQDNQGHTASDFDYYETAEEVDGSVKGGNNDVASSNEEL
jgi:hypothetical protein